MFEARRGIFKFHMMAPWRYIQSSSAQELPVKKSNFVMPESLVPAISSSILGHSYVRSNGVLWDRFNFMWLSHCAFEAALSQNFKAELQVLISLALLVNTFDQVLMVKRQ